MSEGGVDALTTRELAKRSGLSVSSIYQYFSDRDAIIAEYLDREFAGLDTAVAEALLDLEVVTIRGVLESMVFAHLRFLEAHPAAVRVWFGGQQSQAVRATTSEYTSNLAARLQQALTAARLIRADAPEFGVELIVRMIGNVFEFGFLTDRSHAERSEIARHFVDMVAGYTEGFATERGVNGITMDEFARTVSAASSTTPS